MESSAVVSDENTGPKLPTSYYSGPDKALAELLGEALSSIEQILRRLVRDAELKDHERQHFNRALDGIVTTSVWLDRNLGPG